MQKPNALDPFCTQDGVTLYQDDCRDLLPMLPAESVQLVVTSPPYWAQRTYAGVEPSVWDGVDGCEHSWGEPSTFIMHTGSTKSKKERSNRGAMHDTARSDSSTCSICGAWRGTLGNEPTPDLFISHLIGIFGLCRRVLRDDGVMVVNLGDGYASQKSGTGMPRQTLHGGQSRDEPTGYVGRRDAQSYGMKNKSLLLMPFRLALALEADGWVIRSVLPWVKGSALPESVKDRPTSAVEYLIFCVKSDRYVWDWMEVLRDAAMSSLARVAQSTFATQHGGEKDYSNGTNTSRSARQTLENYAENAKSRSYRNSDPFLDSLEMVKRGGGLLLDSDGDPMALLVNPLPLKAAHYATYPPKLVEPFVRAATRTGDMVLDPFAGSGTTLLVAQRLGRRAIGIELSAEYCALAKERLNLGLPMEELAADEGIDLGQLDLFAEVPGDVSKP